MRVRISIITLVVVNIVNVKILIYIYVCSRYYSILKLFTIPFTESEQKKKKKRVKMPNEVHLYKKCILKIQT